MDGWMEGRKGEKMEEKMKKERKKDRKDGLVSKEKMEISEKQESTMRCAVVCVISVLLFYL